MQHQNPQTRQELYRLDLFAQREAEFLNQYGSRSAIFYKAPFEDLKKYITLIAESIPDNADYDDKLINGIANAIQTYFGRKVNDFDRQQFLLMYKKSKQTGDSLGWLAKKIFFINQLYQMGVWNKYLLSTKNCVVWLIQFFLTTEEANKRVNSSYYTLYTSDLYTSDLATSDELILYYRNINPSVNIITFNSENKIISASSPPATYKYEQGLETVLKKFVFKIDHPDAYINCLAEINNQSVNNALPTYPFMQKTGLLNTSKPSIPAEKIESLIDERLVEQLKRLNEYKASIDKLSDSAIYEFFLKFSSILSKNSPPDNQAQLFERLQEEVVSLHSSNDLTRVKEWLAKIFYFSDTQPACWQSNLIEGFDIGENPLAEKNYYICIGKETNTLKMYTDKTTFTIYFHFDGSEISVVNEEGNLVYQTKQNKTLEQFTRFKNTLIDLPNKLLTYTANAGHSEPPKQEVKSNQDTNLLNKPVSLQHLFNDGSLDDFEKYILFLNNSIPNDITIDYHDYILIETLSNQIEKYFGRKVDAFDRNQFLILFQQLNDILKANQNQYKDAHEKSLNWLAATVHSISLFSKSGDWGKYRIDSQGKRTWLITAFITSNEAHKQIEEGKYLLRFSLTYPGRLSLSRRFREVIYDTSVVFKLEQVIVYYDNKTTYFFNKKTDIEKDKKLFNSLLEEALSAFPFNNSHQHAYILNLCDISRLGQEKDIKLTPPLALPVTLNCIDKVSDLNEAKIPEISESLLEKVRKLNKIRSSIFQLPSTSNEEFITAFVGYLKEAFGRELDKEATVRLLKCYQEKLKLNSDNTTPTKPTKIWLSTTVYLIDTYKEHWKSGLIEYGFSEKLARTYSISFGYENNTLRVRNKNTTFTIHLYTNGKVDLVDNKNRVMFQSNHLTDVLNQVAIIFDAAEKVVDAFLKQSKTECIHSLSCYLEIKYGKGLSEQNKQALSMIMDDKSMDLKKYLLNAITNIDLNTESWKSNHIIGFVQDSLGVSEQLPKNQYIVYFTPNRPELLITYRTADDQCITSSILASKGDAYLFDEYGNGIHYANMNEIVDNLKTQFKLTEWDGIPIIASKSGKEEIPLIPAGKFGQFAVLNTEQSLESNNNLLVQEESDSDEEKREESLLKM